MATNIGAQAAALIDDVEKLGWQLQGLGRIGTCIHGNAYDAVDFYNLVAFLTDMQSDRIEKMKTYLEKNVLPIVTHINQP